MANVYYSDTTQSKADVWYLKEITFGTGSSRRQTKIITQNFNGPCSFIAICNILILRGNIEVLPASRQTVSYEFLSQLVGEYLLQNSPDVDVSAALSIMPCTQKGMDLNPLFTAATSFRPAGDAGELKLFEQVGIKLVHGWLVDPASPEAQVIAKTADYDSAVNLIVDADHIAKGQLVVSDDDPIPATGLHSPTISWTAEERSKIEDAMVVRQFLDSTPTQLTYHGLFNLASIIEPGSMVALFRGSHLSVLYKPEEEHSSLYTLVSDYVFLEEPSVVWERLEDIDGGWSTFVDSDFVTSTPVGGDFAGQTAEGALRAEEQAAKQFEVVDPSDRLLAQQLQAHEDNMFREARARQYADRQKLEQEKQEQARRSVEHIEKRKKHKKGDCIIM